MFYGDAEIGIEEYRIQLRVLGTDNGVEVTDVGISFYGVTPIARQIISASPTIEQLAKVLYNLGLVEII